MNFVMCSSSGSVNLIRKLKAISSGCTISIKKLSLAWSSIVVLYSPVHKPEPVLQLQLSKGSVIASVDLLLVTVNH